ncbi:MAG TPA: molybdopterin-dependent oxidoreductase [Candidatus Angelobacter sp.]|jgi:DMSO/TMAO reductase YedYZ molybdopterin-dependent catalytic subunit|nr:molybdopterin-dependent oxidoreductase [Candidatus Angelobacter sp.]
MSLFSRRPPDPRVVADPHRLPPGQVLTEKWPVLHYGSVPRYPADLGDWRLRVTGDVETPLTLTYDELHALPGGVDVHCDIHCVTTWSRLDNTFTGVRLRDLLDRAGARPSGRFVVFRCAQGFTTSIPIEVAREDDAAVVWAHDGVDLAPEHGWPLRALVPRKYFWKSAKWLEEIEVSDRDQLGFWERNGYNNSADPWREERYW